MTPDEFKLLVETDKGKPAGDLLRRYWQPVALASDLGRRPCPVTVMGEELVLFRDDKGRVGLVGKHCPHRSVDLSYGRIEDGGLRCLYHGWLFDIGGRCLEQPAEPAESRYKDEIRHTAYPCREAAGTIFAYLGPGEPPLFPNFHFLHAPSTHLYATKLYHECNYLQANEGNFDPAHLSFLHSFPRPFQDRSAEAQRMQNVLIRRTSPKINVQPTRYGLRMFARRPAENGKVYVRVGSFVMPNIGFFVGEEGDRGQGGYSVHWHVPINDASHWRYDFYYHPTNPPDQAKLEAKQHQLADENYRPRRTPENRYLQDPDEMEKFSFSGMGSSFPAHDLFAVQSPGAVHDRTREHLASSDVAIVALRRMMVEAMKGLARGEEPPAVLRSANENVFNDIVVIGALIDESQDPFAWCDGIARSGDFHAMRV